MENRLELKGDHGSHAFHCLKTLQGHLGELDAQEWELSNPLPSR